MGTSVTDVLWMFGLIAVVLLGDYLAACLVRADERQREREQR